jgi:hypothetical protein
LFADANGQHGHDQPFFLRRGRLKGICGGGFFARSLDGGDQRVTLLGGGQTVRNLGQGFVGNVLRQGQRPAFLVVCHLVAQSGRQDIQARRFAHVDQDRGFARRLVKQSAEFALAWLHNQVAHFLSLEAVLHQRVRQLLRGSGEVGRADIGVGQVQFAVAFALGAWHAQYAPQYLFNSGGTVLLSYGTEYVCIRAVPPFAQGLDGDDITNGAGGAGKVDAVQLVAGAGGAGNLIGRHAVVILQAVLDDIDGHSHPVLRTGLCLHKHDGADVLPCRDPLLVRNFLKRSEGCDGVAKQVAPLRAGLQAYRQLDHKLRFELGSGDAAQYVARVVLAVGGGGQFKNTGRLEARQGFKGELGAGVVGLVDDDDRAVDAQHVCQGRHGRAVGVAFDVQAGRGVGEVANQCACRLVDLAPVRVFHAKGLHGCDDHDAAAARGSGLHKQGFTGVKYSDIFQPAFERLAYG